MKRFLMLGLSVLMLCCPVTGCGKTRVTETENSTEIVAIDFSDFEKNLSKLKSSYETVKDAYESNSVEADADIEAKLSAAADVLNKFGDIKQEEFDSQEALNSANKDVTDAITVLDAVAGNLNAPTAAVSYEQVKEKYDEMVEAYNRLSAVPADKQSAETKTALEKANGLITQTGEITDESFKTQQELVMFGSLVEETLEELKAAEEVSQNN